jgi:hypothetical protein
VDQHTTYNATHTTHKNKKLGTQNANVDVLLEWTPEDDKDEEQLYLEN